MGVRRATSSDISQMVALSAKLRAEYATYSPVFWRPAANASAAQEKYFASLVDDPALICLVHQAAAGVDGFIIARVVSAPPVYDPGGKVVMIDDFAVAEPSLWQEVGMALHAETERIAAQQGAVLSVTVCGERDIAKRTQLRHAGAEVASEWYVRRIGDSARGQ